MTAGIDERPTRREELLTKKRRRIFWGAARSTDYPTWTGTGLVTGLSMQVPDEGFEACTTIALEVLVPRDAEHNVGHLLLRGVQLTAIADSPAVDAVFDPREESATYIEVMCDVDHAAPDSGMPNLERAIRTVHFDEHTDAWAICQAPICREWRQR